jgi:Bacterial SH3 domain
MGQLKLILPASKAGDHHDKGRARSHSLTAAELAVVQRFAPPIPAREGPPTSEPQKQVELERPPVAEQPPAPPPPPIPAPSAAPSGLTLTPSMRMLIGGLIVAALVPNLILGSVFLFGGTNSSAPTAETAVPVTDAASPPAVLTTPPILRAAAGDQVPFPIALDGTDGVPARSIIAISGLPHGANFSDGRPYGDTEWNLRSDQIGDLRLILPDTASGESKLAIKLIAPDGAVVAHSDTTLEVAPAPTEQAGAPASADAALAAIQEDVGVEERITPGQAAAAPPGDAATAPAEELAEPQSDNADQTASASAQTETEESAANTVRPSAYVNLRDGPSSSSRIVGVVAKGAKLSLTERKRGWLHVTDPATSKEGWIYSGYIEGGKKSRPRVKRTARTEPAQKPASSSASSSSFWSNVGRWLGGTSAGSSAKSSN